MIEKVKGETPMVGFLNKIIDEVNALSALSGEGNTVVTKVGGKRVIRTTTNASYLIGLTGGTWSKGSLSTPTSCEIDIYTNGKEVDSAWTDTGNTVTAYDTGMIPSSLSPIPEGSQVRIVRIGATWLFDGVDCDIGEGGGS